MALSQDDWIFSLNEKRNLKIVSSAALVDKVKEKLLIKYPNGKVHPLRKNNIEIVKEFQNEKIAKVKPAEILLSLTKATTPIIENLVDLTSTWALFRYIWAFEPNGKSNNKTKPKPVGKMKLSSYVKNIDFHQKGLLSDELGVGFAAYIMQEFYKMRDLIDMDIALKDSNYWAQRIRRVSSKSPIPDYLFYDTATDKFNVVECKGTMSHNNSYWQLARGMEQVPSIILQNGNNSIPSYVIATVLSGTEIIVNILDPEQEKKPKKEYEGEKSKKSGNVWEIIDNEKFYSDIRLFSKMKKLSFAGLYNETSDLLKKKFENQKFEFNKKKQDIQTISTELGDCQGIKFNFVNNSNRKVTIFKGMNKEILASCKTYNDNAEESRKDLSKITKLFEQKYLSKELDKSEESSSTVYSEIDEKKAFIKLTTIGSDGSVLEISFSKQ